MKNKNKLAKLAIIDNSPHIKKALEKYGQKVGDAIFTSKEIASLATLKSLTDKGLTFDYVADKLKECMEATTFMTRKVSKDEDELVEIIDHKTRLNSVLAYVDLLGIRKGITVPDMEVQTEQTTEIKFSFKPTSENIEELS